MRTKNKTVIILCGIVVSFAVNAWAYVPPSFRFAQALAQRNKPIREGVTIQTRVQIGSLSFREQLDLLPDYSVRVVISEDGPVKVITRNLKDPQSQMMLYTMLYSVQESSVFEQLKKAGLPLQTEDEVYATRPEEKKEGYPFVPEREVSSYVQVPGGKTALCLGRPPISSWVNEPSSSQLCLEKPSLQPLRAFLPVHVSQGSEAKTLDFRFSGITNQQDYLYPRITEIYSSGRLWAKIEVLNVEKKKYQPTAVGQLSEPSSGLSTELESYLKWIR